MAAAQSTEAGLGSADRRQFHWLDWILLATLGPLALVCLGLHSYAAATDALVFHAFYVSPASGPADAPRVEGFLAEFENTGELQIGDRILSVDGIDTHGAGPLEVSRLTYAHALDDVTLMEIERGGVAETVSVPIVAMTVPWARIPALLGFTIAGLIALLRSPGSSHTRLMYVAFMNLVIFESLLPLVWPAFFYPGVLLFNVGGVIGISSIGMWMSRFPPDLDPVHRFHWGWPVGAGLLWSIPRITHYTGGPLPLSSLTTSFFAVDAGLVLFALMVLSVNYKNSDAVGRRQLKSVLLGLYLGILPLAFMGILVPRAQDFDGLRTLHALAMCFVVFSPIAILIAIARFNLFDIDRMISGTASYTGVLILAAVVGEVLIEPIAGLLGESLGFDRSSTQNVFVGLVAGFAFPIQRAWRPYVDRVFFTKGKTQTEEIEHLLEELPAAAAGGTDALLHFVGERLDAAFEPTFCVVYERQEETFHPAFVAGDAPAHPLPEAGCRVIAHVLDKRLGPIRLDTRGRTQRDATISKGVREALGGLDASLLAPVRPHGALASFLCLGPKRSGDVYTPTDVTLLASVAHHASEELAAAGEV